MLLQMGIPYLGAHMFVNKKLSCILLFLCIMMLTTSCQTSSVYIIDADTGEAICDALVFAYCREILTLGPRQQLNTTNEEGMAKINVKGTVDLWAGKQGYYPAFHHTYTRGSFFSIKGEIFPPATIFLHKVKSGNSTEARKVRNHAGIIIYYDNPPCKTDLLKILQYMHWVYINTAFYDDDISTGELKMFFEKYLFKMK